MCSVARQREPGAEDEEGGADRSVDCARGTASAQRPGEARGEVRVRGQPREHERAHRDDHRRWEQRAAAVADELRDERRPEEPDLDVEQVARQPAAQGDGAGDLRARTVDRRERIAPPRAASVTRAPLGSSCVSAASGAPAHRKYVRVRDRAGNYSSWRSVRVSQHRGRAVAGVPISTVCRWTKCSSRPPRAHRARLTYSLPEAQVDRVLFRLVVVP
jgi:hypothetical protein